ncbi:MAG TPA: FadR/GntR family transcriptional regulator [Terriglobia bacterium]|nr:FadR/GntR family transcriptional regulator [Terriglobia bacterium]
MPNIPWLKPRPPLHKKVAEIISEQIISGKYPPNTFLPPEPALCQRMGVSRTVIREAVKRLESSGLVHVRRGIGTKVLDARHDSVSDPLKILLRRRNNSVQDLLEARKILEVGIAGLAAQRHKPENLRAMEQAIRMMRERPGEPEGYIHADLGFHTEIARATQNPTFLIILELLQELLRESRVASFSGPRVVLMRAAQHERIYQAIRKRDARGVQAAMVDHLNATKRDLARRKISGLSEGRRVTKHKAKRAAVPTQFRRPRQSGSG